MKQAKHFTAVILLISMFLTMYTPLQAFGENVEPLQFDGSQSTWAEPEIKEAYDMSLTYPAVTNNFNKYITREEFCTLVIKLYEKLTGQIPKYTDNPFKDTTNTEILKAHSLGIVKGISADTFAPLNNITRQEMCVMILRALNVSVQGLNTSPGEFPFKDADKIAPWAIDAMKFAYKNGIMKGLSAETIDPLSNTPREQAIILLLRTYKKFSITTVQSIEEAGAVKFSKPPSVSKNIREKFEFTMNSNNIFFPKFDKKLELFVSNKAGKPSTLPIISSLDNSPVLFASLNNHVITYSSLINPIRPINPIDPIETISPIIKDPIIIKPNLPDLVIMHPAVKERTNTPMYINSDFGAFIDKTENSVRWFTYKLNNIRGFNTVSKIVWQVSETQFVGTKDVFRTEKGIVLSGDIMPSSKEFSIDFSKVKSLAQIKKPIPQEQKTYYVRAVPVDALGNPIGDPGQGIAVLYGIPVMSTRESTDASFEIWSTKSHMGNNTTGEFKDVPVHDPFSNGIIEFNPNEANPRIFHFHGLDENTVKIYVQVYSDKFDKNQSYLDYDNLVYEREYYIDDMVPVYPHLNFNPSATVDFKEFGKTDMKADEYIRYYLRAVAITEDIEPGKLKAVYSDIITVDYGFGSPVKFISLPVPQSKYDKVQMINYSLPSVEIKEYTAIDWADPDYLSRYYVFREPKPTEIIYTWMNADGKILKPYKYYVITKELGNFSSSGGFDFDLNTSYEMMPQEFKTKYEKLIKEVLPIGSKIYIPVPKEVDKPWYQEIYEGVVNFFKDLVSTIIKIYAKITETYQALKTKLIMAVANLCPIESLRDEFAKALTALVDYGLSSIGIPPKFPNFEQLAEGNIAYLAQVALTEAGVPASDITEEMTKEAAKGVVGYFKEADKESYDENPVKSPFLKLDPQSLYQPACLEVELENNTDYPTVPGTLDLNVQFKLKEQGLFATSYDPVGLNLVADNNQYGYGSSMAVLNATDYWNHFVYGLNGYTVNYKYGEEAVYEVFEPKVDVKIPVIPAHNSVTLKIFLDPAGVAINNRYPDGENYRFEDFYNMYQNNGGADYTWFEVTTCFPEARKYYSDEYAKKGTIMVLDPKTDYRYHMDTSYSANLGRKIQMPVNIDW